MTATTQASEGLRPTQGINGRTNEAAIPEVYYTIKWQVRGRWKEASWRSYEAAKRAADRVYQSTGIVLGIVEERASHG